MTTSERIYAHALKDLGLAEVPGPKSNPRIEFAIKTSADWLDDDDSVTAWCGCIRGLWGLETGTGVIPAHFRAKNWLDWGKVVLVANAQKGDTVVFSRPGGFHVALFSKLDGGKVYVLGGNQSNKVSIAPYPLTSLHGVRRAA